MSGLAHVVGTQQCTNLDTKFFALQSISSFVNDSLIFIAISYRLAANAATERTWRSWFQSIVKGKGLYHLSRSLMHSGQAYYACVQLTSTLSLGSPSRISSAIMLFFFFNLFMMESPSVPTVLHYAFVNTYIAFTNLMACKIFRGISLGILINDPTSWNTARINAVLESHAPHRAAEAPNRAP